MKRTAMDTIADAATNSADLETSNQTLIRLSTTVIEMLENIDAYLMEHA